MAAWLQPTDRPKVGERLVFVLPPDTEENLFHGDLPREHLLLRESASRSSISHRRIDGQALSHGLSPADSRWPRRLKAVDLMFMLTDSLPVVAWRRSRRSSSAAARGTGVIFAACLLRTPIGSIGSDVARSYTGSPRAGKFGARRRLGARGHAADDVDTSSPVSDRQAGNDRSPAAPE